MTSEQIVKCESCNWEGSIKDCFRIYQGLPPDGEDVELVDFCPNCGSDQLINTKEELMYI